jgi:uncharacterized protein (DUF924 family)
MQFQPRQVLDFWFADEGQDASAEARNAWMTRRMQGGMDAAICSTFADLTLAAARGDLDGWAATPEGRIALIVALDQFPRSLWRDTPAAFGQDIRSCRLALEGIANGHFDALPHTWQMIFYIICISHCEGPDHLERMHALDRVVDRYCARLAPQHAASGDRLRAQHARVTAIIERFGRHPHRNPILGRVSTPDEEAYIAAGDFPHVPKPAPAATRPGG